MRDWWYQIVAEKYGRSPSHGPEVAQIGTEILDFIRANLAQLKPSEPNSKSDSDTFALKVLGDSMMPRIHDGDIIVVDKNARYESGDICVVGLGEEVMLKVVLLDQQYVHLIPLNPIYQSASIGREQITFMFKAVTLVANL